MQVFFIQGVGALSAIKQAFWCTHRDGYSVVAFPAELSSADMSDIRDAGVKVQEHLAQKKCLACVVDLSALSYIGSSMVALIVKIWKLVKAQGGRVVVVAPGANIRDVLKIAGLTKVWTIVDTFEAAVHSLGCSIEAKVEKRERRLLTFVGPIALIGASVAIAAVVAPDKVRLGKPQEWMIHTLGGLSLLASVVCVFRDSGWRRIFSFVGLLLSVSLAGFWLWHKEFRSPPEVPVALPSEETVVEPPTAELQAAEANSSETPESTVPTESSVPTDVSAGATSPLPSAALQSTDSSPDPDQPAAENPPVPNSVESTGEPPTPQSTDQSQ